MKGEKTTKKKNHYINNKEFTELLIAYNNDPDSKVGRQYYEQIGVLLLMLANKVASSPSFTSYTPNIKEEMVQDAIYTMIKNLHKYDYKKYNNPFSYFTSIVINVFKHHLSKMKISMERFVRLETIETNGLEYMISDMPYSHLMNKSQVRTNQKK
jgi:DNA-directed RNA polymerase specialized sigma24 family protein